MKILAILLFFVSFGSYAVPVLNKNVSTTGNSITIWPDHKDPDHFYYAPTRMNLALDKNGKPLLSAIDYTMGSCRWPRKCQRKLLLTTYFEAAYRETDLEATKANILRSNPKANFVPVPFVSSAVQFGTSLAPFIEEHNCSPIGGQSSDLVPCTIVLNEKGIYRLLPKLKQGQMLAFNFSYKIFGAVESPSSGFKDFEAEYAIAVNFGGEALVGLEVLEDFE